jgi:hypothetical protein
LTELGLKRARRRTLERIPERVPNDCSDEYAAQSIAEGSIGHRSGRRLSPDQTEPVAERVTQVRDLTPVSLITAFVRGACRNGARQRYAQVRNDEIQVHRRPVTRVFTMNFQVVALGRFLGVVVCGPGLGLPIQRALRAVGAFT